jgi:hypothetical protein
MQQPNRKEGLFFCGTAALGCIRVARKLSVIAINMIDRTQKPGWTESLRAAMSDVQSGKVRRFKSEEAFFKHLDDLGRKSEPKTRP